MDMENTANADVGNEGASNSETASSNQMNGDTVAHSTFEKLLKQHKKTQEINKELAEKLNLYEQKESEAEKKRLEEKGEYKKLLELREKELDAERKSKEEHEKRLLKMHKLSLFDEKLPGKITKSVYYDHVDVDSILIDPNTGLVDESSVNEVVNKFVVEHSGLIAKDGRDLPSNAAQGQTDLSYEQWLKLPYKEKKAQYHRVINKQ